MDIGAGKFFSSPLDVSKSMPCELSWSTSESGKKLWVFWSRQSNELQSIHSSLYTSVDTSSSGNRTIAEKIKPIIRHLWITSYQLIQFWAPVKTTEGRIYLTTADQPFALTKFHKGLCSYRRFCVSDILISVDGNEMDDEEEHKLSPIARVFRHKFPEFCTDVSYYLREEYSQRDFAIEHGVKNYLALPLFELIGQQCVGVLEILSTSAYDSLHETFSLQCELEMKDLTCHLYLPSNNFRDFRRVLEVHKAIPNTCRSHQLPCAQIWETSSTARGIYLIGRWVANEDDDNGFDSSYLYFSTWGSKGVVEKAFSSRNACFCNNISELSISVYPSVTNARKLRLTGCFAICLQATKDNDYFYILEFFLPRGEVDYGDPRNFLSMLVASLTKEIQSSMGAHVQKLGEKLFVEVLKNSSRDELDSFEICTTTHTEGKEMMQHDFSRAHSRNNISAEQIDVVGLSVRPAVLQNSLQQQAVMEPDVVNEERDIGTGDISISAFGVPAKRSTASKVLDQGVNNTVTTQGDGSSCQESIRKEMQPDSSCQESNRLPDHINRGNLVSMVQDASTGARKQGQENISTKQNIGARFVPDSLSQLSVAFDDINRERSVRTKQDNVNGSRKKGKVQTLDREYGINREVLERHSEKKLEDVAAILGVSRSTLKRICRKYNIFRWPPCKAKKFRPFIDPQVSIPATQRHIEDQSLRNQSDLPLEMCSVSKPQTIPNATEEQDSCNVMVKATYGDDIIKFQLSLSSRKLDLEKEVAMRLNLSVGSFKIKYLDKDEDWVLMAYDADLRTCMRTLRALGKTTIKMQIFQ